VRGLGTNHPTILCVARLAITRMRSRTLAGEAKRGFYTTSTFPITRASKRPLAGVGCGSGG